MKCLRSMIRYDEPGYVSAVSIAVCICLLFFSQSAPKHTRASFFMMSSFLEQVLAFLRWCPSSRSKAQSSKLDEGQRFLSVYHVRDLPLAQAILLGVCLTQW